MRSWLPGDLASMVMHWEASSTMEIAGKVRKRVGDLDALAFVGDEFIGEGVFAGNEGGGIGECAVIAGLAGADESAEILRVGTFGPTEIIENGRVIRIATDANDVAEGFINAAEGHVVGIEIAESGGKAIGKGDGFGTGEDGADDGGIRGAIMLRAHQRFDDGATLHFVIVLADDPMFAGDGRHAEERMQGGGVIFGGSECGLGKCGWRVDGFAGGFRDAIMDEGHIHLGNEIVVVVKGEFAGAIKDADVGGFHIFRRAEIQQRLHIFRRNGQNHAAPAASLIQISA